MSVHAEEQEGAERPELAAVSSPALPQSRLVDPGPASAALSHTNVGVTTNNRAADIFRF